MACRTLAIFITVGTKIIITLIAAEESNSSILVDSADVATIQILSSVRIDCRVFQFMIVITFFLRTCSLVELFEVDNWKRVRLLMTMGLDSVVDERIHVKGILCALGCKNLTFRKIDLLLFLID